MANLDEIQARQFELFMHETRRALRKVMGPAWKPSRDKDDLIRDVYVAWISPSGLGAQAGLVVYRPDPAGQLSPLFAVFDEEELEPTLTPIARVVGRAALERWRREQGEEGLQFLRAPEPSTAPADEEELTEIEGMLPRLRAGDAADRALAALVSMHMGELAVRGMPRKLLPERRFQKKTGVWVTATRGQAFEDLQKYHALGRKKHAGKCPTCRILSRFFRVPGLTPEAVQEAIDGFLARGR